MRRKTVGLADVVRSALAAVESKIDVAFIYGSVATGTERSASDVDLMVIGQASLADLALILRSLEEQLGRTVNASVYATREFRRKVNKGNHFLNSVLRTDLIFVFGKPDDLARLVESAQGARASDDSTGDLRSSRGG